MRMGVDYSLYLVTDRPLSLGRNIENIVEKAVRGGVSAVQLREKDASTREFLDIAIKLKKMLTRLNIPLIINDRVDIALASGADGVHIGQSDMPYPIVARLMGPDAIIGLSVENIEQAGQANEYDLDYIGLSPIFSTPTKTDIDTSLGLEGISAIKEISRHTCVSIGGINRSNAAEIIDAGSDGIAVVSAIVSAPDVYAASADLRSIIHKAKSAK